MCGRYVSPDEASIEREFDLVRTERRLAASFNTAPSQTVPAIRVREGNRESVPLRWGFGQRGTFNARSETLPGSVIFRGPWNRGQRCIVPAQGFYEWHVNADGTKQPFYVHLDDQAIFGFAGLWERGSCTIITLPANALMAGIDNCNARMPAILAREMRELWLCGRPEAAGAALQAYEGDRMIAYPVHPWVNSPHNNDETLLDPLLTDAD